MIEVHQMHQIILKVKNIFFVKPFRHFKLIEILPFQVQSSFVYFDIYIQLKVLFNKHHSTFIKIKMIDFIGDY